MLQLLLCDAQACTLGVQAELRLSGFVLRVDDGVCAAYWTDVEESVHALQWYSLGFLMDECQRVLLRGVGSGI